MAVGVAEPRVHERKSGAMDIALASVNAATKLIGRPIVRQSTKTKSVANANTEAIIGWRSIQMRSLIDAETERLGTSSICPRGRPLIIIQLAAKHRKRKRANSYDGGIMGVNTINPNQSTKI